MTKNFTYEQALMEPDECFSAPEEIIANNSYSNEQKLKLLEQWENDVKELMVAEGENMPKKTKNGSNPGEILGKIHKAMESLN